MKEIRMLKKIVAGALTLIVLPVVIVIAVTMFCHIGSIPDKLDKTEIGILVLISLCIVVMGFIELIDKILNTSFRNIYIKIPGWTLIVIAILVLSYFIFQLMLS